MGPLVGKKNVLVTYYESIKIIFLWVLWRLQKSHLLARMLRYN